MDSPRLKADPSSDISPWYYFLILFPNSYLLLSAVGSFLSPLMPSKNSKLWFSFECLSWRPKARKSIHCPFPSLIPTQISAQPPEMLKRCKITASPASPGAKPVWFRKAPECLHRQILKKYFPLKHNPPAHPPPLPARSPLTPYHSLPGNYLLRLLPPGRSQSSGSGSRWQEITRRRELAVLPSPPPISHRSRRAQLRGTASFWGWALAPSRAAPGEQDAPLALPASQETGRHRCCRDGECSWAEPWVLSRSLSLPTAHRSRWEKLGCPWSPPIPPLCSENSIGQRNSVSLGWGGAWGCSCACQG